ncbi:MAG: MFS transporter, partial [Bacteroidetes bacterium]|nr:MFS transporter [bacterium]NBP67027.1 MFS transporter [Bacteroidota bacterium]
MQMMNIKGKVILLMASSLTVMSVSAISPALPKIANAFNAIDNAEFLVKLMLTIPSFIIALFAPIAGLIIDNGKRKLLLISSLIIYGLMGTTGLYLESLHHFIIARAFLGLGVAGIMTSAQTLIADYYVGEERNRMLGLQGAFISFGGVIFVALAGFLATASWRYPFVLYSLALILAIPALAYIQEPSVKEQSETIQLSQTNENIQHVSAASIAGIGLIVFVGMVFFYAIPTQLPFLLALHGIESPAKAGTVVSLATLAGGFSSYSMPYLTRKYHFSLLGGRAFAMLAIGFLGLSVSGTFLMTILFSLFAGAGIGLLMPTMRLWVITIASLPLRGRSVGFITSS